jgi:hypothetical protein
LSGGIRRSLEVSFGLDAQGRSLAYDERSAELSGDGFHRYQLRRAWEPLPRTTVLWVMLNPSTADANIDDPTIRRCVAFSKVLGFGGLVVVNLFALRATDPAELLAVKNPLDAVGPDNDRWIAEEAVKANGIICAWGANVADRRLKERAARVLKMLGSYDLFCLKRTAGGMPSHPLYLKSDLKPVLFQKKGGSHG